MTAEVRIEGGSSTGVTFIFRVKLDFKPAVLLTSKITTSEPVKLPSGIYVKVELPAIVALPYIPLVKMLY